MWEDRRLRDVTEADIRQLVDSGMEEHLQLEYKREVYLGNLDGRKESLLDICMFANAGGGILLIGIDELRDADGRATGAPDPNAELGVQVENPEQLLQSYDARVVAAIQERLPLESYPIPVGNNRHVLAIRVPNSLSKPHRVQLESHSYFPSRRERHRYYMDVREIKEMVMRTASRIEGAEEKLNDELNRLVVQANNQQHGTASIVMGFIPVFWQNFMLDIRKAEVIEAARNLHLGHGYPVNPTYDFNGLKSARGGGANAVAVQVRRDGMIIVSRNIPLNVDQNRYHFRPSAIDLTLRSFVQQCRAVYEAAGISSPFLLGIAFSVNQTTRALFGNVWEEPGDVVINPGAHAFPVMQADNLVDVDKIIRPLCDQAHQMFGEDSSPNFDENGVWDPPR